MNAARKTARKHRHLLNKGASQDPKTFLGRWALKIWRQGIGYNKRKLVEAVVEAGKVNAAQGEATS